MLAKREPWEQRYSECDIEYRQFEHWLQLPLPRTAPNDQQLAITHNWVDRAIAYDNAHMLAASPGGLVEQGMTNLLRALAIESNKLFIKTA